MEKQIIVTDLNLMEIFDLPCVTSINKAGDGVRVRIRLAPGRFVYVGYGGMMWQGENGAWHVNGF